MENESNFLPIGGWENETTIIGDGSTKKFYGTFDGDNHTITGLIIKRSATESHAHNYIGLFGVCDINADIKKYRNTKCRHYKERLLLEEYLEMEVR
ncbi:MAG: hypothetical protein LKE30_01115 [Bacteroidales bacterium]|nr:hypothetical protein [Bacteroidales bacterium]